MTIYRFKINDAFTPETIPMARLAEYVAELARLFGEQQSVHLSDVREGSVEVFAAIDFGAVRKVQDRLGTLDHDPAPDLKTVLQKIDDLLASDNATGTLMNEVGESIFDFLGRDRPKPLIYGPFKEDGFIDGQVIRIGGKDETIHIHLMDGQQVYSGCTATRELARRLAPFFLGPPVRVQGTGTWERKGSGDWELKNFRISDFVVLDDSPLAEVIAKLRAVEGNEWIDEQDPIGVILHERGTGELPH
ncbi:hypothetical protein [Rhizobium leguminosarum]